MVKRCSLLALLSLMVWLEPSARADSARPGASDSPSAPLSESLHGMARAEYEAGKILYADGDFSGAAMKFQRAYDESKDPRLLWNMAAAEKNLRHYVRVYTLVERYLAEASTRLSADDRSEAETLLGTVKGFIGEVTIRVNEPGASISVDDQPLGASPLPGAVRLEMGERKITVHKVGFTDFVATQPIDGGAATEIDVTLKADVHEGRLRIVAGADDSIRVDGRLLGLGQWEGKLKSGIHAVQVSAEGKQPYQSDIGVEDGQLANVRVTLEAKAAAQRVSAPVWPWVVGGAALAGLSVGAYFLFRPRDEGPAPPVDGSLDPGSIPLGLRF
jgi:tetratricopeptide (TPR) repeat protein